MDSSESNASSPAPCNASENSVSPPATHGATIISDIATASKWLQDHAHAEYEDRDHLVKFCEMLQRNQKNRDKEEWHRELTTWKTSDIKRKTRNEKGYWRNRLLSDIKCDVQDALIKRVKELAKSFDKTAGVIPPSASSSASARSPVQQEQRSTSNTCHGTKRSASVLTKETEENAATRSKRNSSEREQGNAATASGTTTLPVKRKTIERGSSASSAIAPAQRPKTSQADESATANKTTMSVEQWAELHELEAWLTSTDAPRILGNDIALYRSIVGDLLCYPPTRTGLQSAAERLHQTQNRQSVYAWHYRCVQEILQCYRIWKRPSGFADWKRAGPQPAVVEDVDAAVPFVQSVDDMRTRQDHWWTTELTKSFRRFSTLRTKYPELIDAAEWKTLETRFGLVLRSANTSSAAGPCSVQRTRRNCLCCSRASNPGSSTGQLVIITG